jgi:hypothetical protein
MVRFIDCLFKHALLTKLQLQEQEAPEFLMVRGGLGKLKIVIGPGTFFFIVTASTDIRIFIKFGLC